MQSLLTSYLHYTIFFALFFNASEVSKKLLSDYEVVILYHNLLFLNPYTHEPALRAIPPCFAWLFVR